MLGCNPDQASKDDSGLSDTAGDVAGTWCADNDGNGYGNPDDCVTATEQPEGYVPDSANCDDGRQDIHPWASEYCDGVDDDCDGVVDEADSVDAAWWYRDFDGDGYGAVSVAEEACSAPEGFVADSADCDDADPTVHPEADELCDDIDNDCDGVVDEDVVSLYLDADGDGYGDPAVVTCLALDGYLYNGDDCDDTDPAVHPGATDEPCDGIDSDCDGIGADVAAFLAHREYSLVQDSIDDSPTGGTVYVCPGLHTESLQVVGDKDLVLASWTGDSSDTTFSGMDTDVSLDIRGGASVAVEAIGFEQGQAGFCGDYEGPCGGAVCVVESSLVEIGGFGEIELEISSCEFVENQAESEGGAVSAGGWYRTGVNVSDSLFIDNYADGCGGGLNLGSWDFVEAVITGTDFTGNSSGSCAGAILMSTAMTGDLATELQDTYTASPPQSGNCGV